jgi:hypothetical protein
MKKTIALLLMTLLLKYGYSQTAEDYFNRALTMHKSGDLVGAIT